MKNTFTTSSKEMNRRKTAFQSLSACLFVSMTLMGFTSFSSDRQTMSIIVLFGFFLLLSAVFFFNHLLEVSKQILVTVNNEGIERTHAGSHNRHPIEPITHITVKRNVKGTIREIRFKTKASGSFYINGLNDFENFLNCILTIVNKEVIVTTVREPIDFDHWLFYPILGISVGTLSIMALNTALSLDTKAIVFLQCTIALFSASLGIYWLICKPMSGRYGKKSYLPDIITGAVMVLTSVYLLFVSGIFDSFHL